MFGYDFPELRHIDDIAEALESPHISAFEKNGLIFASYNVLDKTLFAIENGGALTREMRGICFDAKTGDLKSRPLGKAFNLDENEEHQFKNIDWTMQSRVMTKLDGSMTRPLVFDDGELVLGTKRGLSDAAKLATKHLYEAYPDEVKKLREMWESGLTPCFEFTSPDHRIVVGYDVPQLMLLDVRDNLTGEYLGNPMGLGIPMVQDYTPWHEEWADLPIEERIQKLYFERANEEGAFIRFKNGAGLKIKCAWYHNIHRIVGQLTSKFPEHHVAQLVLDQNVDDILPFLMPKKRDWVVNYQQEMLDAIAAQAERLQGLYTDIYSLNVDNPKGFADMVRSEISEKRDQTVIFAIKRDPTEDVRDIIIGQLRKNIHKDVTWQEVSKWLLKETTRKQTFDHLAV